MKRLSVAIALASALPLASLACEDESSAPGAGVPEAGHLVQLDATTTPDSPAEPSLDASVKDASGAGDAGACPIGFDETVTATMKVTADDYLTLWVNGVLVVDKQSTWGTVENTTVTLFRHPSRKNVIAIEARNAFLAGGHDRGLLADLSIAAPAAGDDAGVASVVTDVSWKIIGELTDGGLPASGLPDGGTPGVAPWFAPAFDDSGWRVPTDQGPHGMAPYGPVFGTSTARWLWSYDFAAAASKPVTELAYFRKAFYLRPDVTLSDAPPACP